MGTSIKTEYTFGDNGVYKSVIRLKVVFSCMVRIRSKNERKKKRRMKIEKKER